MLGWATEFLVMLMLPVFLLRQSDNDQGYSLLKNSKRYTIIRIPQNFLYGDADFRFHIIPAEDIIPTIIYLYLSMGVCGK